MLPYMYQIWDNILAARCRIPHSRRLRDEAGQYRVFVHRKAGEDILVLRAFRKKSAQTPSCELEIARRRLKELTDES